MVWCVWFVVCGVWLCLQDLRAASEGLGEVGVTAQLDVTRGGVEEARDAHLVRRMRRGGRRAVGWGGVE